jgi:hypothetical protein
MASQETARFATRLLFHLQRPISLGRHVPDRERASWVQRFLERGMGPDSGASVVAMQDEDGSWHIEIRVQDQAARAERHATILGIPVLTVCPGDRSR